MTGDDLLWAIVRTTLNPSRFTTTRMTLCGAGEEDQARSGLSAFEFPISLRVSYHLDIEKMPPQLSRLCTTGADQNIQRDFWPVISTCNSWRDFIGNYMKRRTS
nr:uncharacterized protein LOC127296529 [Lolium perenne]